MGNEACRKASTDRELVDDVHVLPSYYMLYTSAVEWRAMHSIPEYFIPALYHYRTSLFSFWTQSVYTSVLSSQHEEITYQVATIASAADWRIALSFITAGVTGDWLEAADQTCTTLVLQRRREVLEVYRHGRLDAQSTACSSPAKEVPEAIRYHWAKVSPPVTAVT